jgi:hydroxypyruvate isomerase
MRRRNFIRSGITAGGALLAPAGLLAAENNTEQEAGNTFKLNYAFHDGMFKNFAGKDFSEQIRFGYDQGFRAI